MLFLFVKNGGSHYMTKPAEKKALKKDDGAADQNHFIQLALCYPIQIYLSEGTENIYPAPSAQIEIRIFPQTENNTTSYCGCCCCCYYYSCSNNNSYQISI